MLHALVLLFAQQPAFLEIPFDTTSAAWFPAQVAGAGFVPSLVEIQFRVQSAWQFQFENLDSNETHAYWGNGPLINYDEDCRAGIEFRSGSQSFFTATAWQPTVEMTLAPFDGTVDFSGLSGQTSSWLRSSISGFIDVDDPAILALFNTDGLVSFEFNRFSVFWLTADHGNAVYSVLNKSGGHFRFVYFP